MIKFKIKEFKSPTEEPVRVMSHDGYFIDWVYPEWTSIREEEWQDAYSKGCISKDMNRVGINPMEAIANLQAQEKAYEDKVCAVMEEILKEGDPDKIDSFGKPKTRDIGLIVGQDPSAQLRNKIFKQITNK